MSALSHGVSPRPLPAPPHSLQAGQPHPKAQTQGRLEGPAGYSPHRHTVGSTQLKRLITPAPAPKLQDDSPPAAGHITHWQSFVPGCLFVVKACTSWLLMTRTHQVPLQTHGQRRLNPAGKRNPCPTSRGSPDHRRPSEVLSAPPCRPTSPPCPHLQEVPQDCNALAPYWK